MNPYKQHRPRREQLIRRDGKKVGRVEFVLVMIYLSLRFYWSNFKLNLECWRTNLRTMVKHLFRRSVKPANCTDCAHHRVVSDRNPFDPFRLKDKAVLCNRMEPLPHRRKGFKRRIVACACEASEMRVECSAPSWCPMNEVK